jgi:calcyclin binding protein
MIVIFLRKSETKNWSCVTEKEMKQKDKTSVPKMDPSADPQEGLMSMMKKMYEEGDDEMKRTISKAFTESREKQGADGMGIPGMPGMGM